MYDDDLHHADALTIEQLKEQHNKLNTRKIQAATELSSAEKELQKLEQEAFEEFGTSDVDELQAKLKLMEEENERKRRDYQALLEGIRADLAKIDEPDAAEDESARDAKEQYDDDVF